MMAVLIAAYFYLERAKARVAIGDDVGHGRRDANTGRPDRSDRRVATHP